MRTGYRASLFHCLDDPGAGNDAAAWQILEDGVLVVDEGFVVEAGPAAQLFPLLGADARIVDHSGQLILPGFVDCHVHCPQLDIIAADGSKLLEWLERYAYPEEMKFADRTHADEVAAVFLDELLRRGTTTALVFATVHPQSADALFEAALARNMRLIAGKVLMDRNCPPGLADDAASGYADSRRLIERWHGQGRLGYAITPRFAITSSDAQLEAAGRLAAEFPDVWIHTHLAENVEEVAEVARLFPGRQGYLDVYRHHGLLRERAVFAHCLHLDRPDLDALAAGHGAAAFCPTSNLFLGSGLFDLDAAAAAGVRVGLATDVGGGTNLSMLTTMGEAYKVLKLKDQSLPAARGVYLATLGAARALGLGDKIGNFEPGKEADFVVLDPAATPLTARRAAGATSVLECIFALAFLGDDRHVAATYVAGEKVTLA